MTKGMLKIGMAVLFVGTLPCLAQNTSGNGAAKPDNATGQCKDGSYTTAANKSGACRGHQGIKDWYQTVGGKSDPDIKSSKNTGNGRSSSGNANGNSGAPSSDLANPHSNADAVSNQRANAINKKSGNEVVATPNNTTQQQVPGPAANNTAGNSGNMNSGAANSGNAGKHSSRSMANRTAAPGGGPGMVWVNTESKVYHCYGTEFYGKTKAGQYMTEQQAQQSGAHADHGKSCSK